MKKLIIVVISCIIVTGLFHACKKNPVSNSGPSDAVKMYFGYSSLAKQPTSATTTSGSSQSSVKRLQFKNSLMKSQSYSDSIENTWSAGCDTGSIVIGHQNGLQYTVLTLINKASCNGGQAGIMRLTGDSSNTYVNRYQNYPWGANFYCTGQEYGVYDTISKQGENANSTAIYNITNPTNGLKYSFQSNYNFTAGSVTMLDSTHDASTSYRFAESSEWTSGTVKFVSNLLTEQTEKFIGYTGTIPSGASSTSSQYLPVDYIISGKEKVDYTINGQSGEFIIDYGNGAFDGIATITENGNSYQVNYTSIANMFISDLSNK